MQLLLVEAGEVEGIFIGRERQGKTRLLDWQLGL